MNGATALGVGKGIHIVATSLLTLAVFGANCCMKTSRSQRKDVARIIRE